MTRYRHRQVGTLVLALGGLTLALLGALLLGVGPHPVGIAVLGVLILCFVLLSTLTVEVTETHLRLRFGPGAIRKTFALESIRDARAVRNRWYFGWGIRVLPRGWMYNVSGLDAIEIEMRDGRVHRIGTDEPAELLKAVREACGAATRRPGV